MSIRGRDRTGGFGQSKNRGRHSRHAAHCEIARVANIKIFETGLFAQESRTFERDGRRRRRGHEKPVRPMSRRFHTGAYATRDMFGLSEKGGRCLSMAKLLEGEKLEQRCRTLGVDIEGSPRTQSTSGNSPRASDYELQRRLIETERAIRENSLWKLAVLSAIVSIVSAAGAWMAVFRLSK